MKKKIFTALFLFLVVLLNADEYRINKVIYNISGKTKENRISKNVPVDTSKIFKSEEELQNYINDYIVRLNNTRNFSFIDVKYSINSVFDDQTLDEDMDSEPVDSVTVTEVSVIVNLTDSTSFIALPYPKFDSNTGTSIKIKAKDTNFFGSMNTMSADFDFLFSQTDINAPLNYKLGVNFSYDHPFDFNSFDLSWVNDFQINYTFSDSMPEWNGKTGIKFNIPHNNLSYVIELYQYAVRDRLLARFDDQIYFREQAKISLPIVINQSTFSGNLIYTPFIDFNYYWDYNGIMITNNALSGPTLSIGHTITAGRVNWYDNMRKGFTLAFTNYYLYNYQRDDFIPYIGLDIKAYYHFKDSNNWLLKRIGICGSFYSFIYVPFNNHKTMYGEMIGTRLRGIRDEQFFSMNTGMFGLTYACNTSTAVVFSLDVPIHLFTTNFKKSFLKYLNFDLQFSPFIDVALGYNRFTNRYYHFKDGFYAGGFEILAYPLKWSSFTLRGSLGFDLGRVTHIVDSFWRSEVSKFEVSIGIGLQY